VREVRRVREVREARGRLGGVQTITDADWLERKCQEPP